MARRLPKTGLIMPRKPWRKVRARILSLLRRAETAHLPAEWLQNKSFWDDFRQICEALANALPDQRDPNMALRIRRILDNLNDAVGEVEALQTLSIADAQRVLSPGAVLSLDDATSSEGISTHVLKIGAVFIHVALEPDANRGVFVSFELEKGSMPAGVVLRPDLGANPPTISP